jgi:hypothetical protein
MHQGPVENQSFREVQQLTELEGVYVNKGDPKGFLSQEIWPKVGNFSHEAIQYIEVNAANDALIVKAIKNDCVVYERSYLLGRDFSVVDGAISIRSESHAVTRGPGDVVVGPSFQSKTLGIDKSGNGKARDSFFMAGLVFMIFPIALSDTKEVRYLKSTVAIDSFEKCSGFGGGAGASD